MNRDTVLIKMLDSLWTQYKTRVSYAAQYEQMVVERGGRVINDHVAFRTFNTALGGQPAGVEGIARVFTALGYERKDKYLFEDKHLTAWHYEHTSNGDNPKIFISQLEVEELPVETAQKIKESVKDTPELLSPSDRDLLATLAKGESIGDPSGEAFIKNLAAYFSRPWSPPKRSAIAPVNKISQYAAWTLLNGNSVNHFTAYINGQKIPGWPDLETTVNALREAGLPMKDEMEGERGSKLRQSSTQAAETDVDITEENGSRGKMTWSYAYYELAERGMVPGPDGNPVLFQAFLGAQATNLFEMTKRD